VILTSNSSKSGIFSLQPTNKGFSFNASGSSSSLLSITSASSKKELKFY